MCAASRRCSSSRAARWSIRSSARRSRATSCPRSSRSICERRYARQVVIIGSGPAGLTAALYARRANLHPLVIEGLEAGGQLMITTMVENWPGYRDGIMGPDLMDEMRAQAQRFGAEHHHGPRHVGGRRAPPVPHHDRGRTSITRRALIIATGASARWLGLPSERTLVGRGVSSCATCDGFFFRGRPIAVVGGGDYRDGRGDLPDALCLAGDGRPPARHAARVEDHAGQGVRQPEDRVRVEHRGRRHPGRQQGRGDRRRAAQRAAPASARSSRSTACSWRSATCRTPRSSPASSRWTRTATSSRTTARSTSVAGVFACGDVQDSRYRQAITAAGSGCMAAIDAEQLSRARRAPGAHGQERCSRPRVSSTCRLATCRFSAQHFTDSINPPSAQQPRPRRRTLPPVRA